MDPGLREDIINLTSKVREVKAKNGMASNYKDSAQQNKPSTKQTGNQTNGRRYIQTTSLIRG